MLCAVALPHNNPLQDALEIIQKNHIAGDDTQLITKKMLAGALRALDPYSAYFPPDQYRLVKQLTQGNLCGIGLELWEQDGKVIVQSVIQDGPADHAGIHPGDIITHIDGKEIVHFTPPDVISAQLNGKPETSVIIGVNDRHISIKRANLKIPTVSARMRQGKLCIRIRYFADSTADDLRQVMEAHMGAKSIVLDLRNNPGGSLHSAIETAGIFLDTAPIVQVKSRMSAYNKTYICQGRALCPHTPLTVLINQHTASSAEIVAAALKDYDRAVLKGERSLGKGLIQDFFDLPGYGGIKLTVGSFYSPNGHPIQDCGVSPHYGGVN